MFTEKMYTLTFTKRETDSIDFVGHRHSWSSALQKLLCYDDDGEPETLSLSESQAWELRNSFEEDTEGGHSFFPMLDSNSVLYAKLWDFLYSLI